MTTEKNNLGGAIMAMAGFLFIVQLFDWLIGTRIIDTISLGNNSFAMIMYSGVQSKILFVRSLLLFCILGYGYSNPSFKVNKGLKKKDKIIYWIIAIATAILVLIGYRINYWYAVLIYPIVNIICFYFIIKAVNSIRERPILDIEDGVSCLDENDMSIDFQTDKGTLRVHSPQQGIAITGGAGAGKSASLFVPMIDQLIKKDFPMVIYDFKGNPATLGRDAYNALLAYSKNKKSDTPQTKYGMINFTDTTRCVRCNPLDPIYINNTTLIKEAAQLIMYSVNKSWVKNPDFWAGNAISLLVAVIVMLRDNHPDKCTLPHAIAAILSDGDTLLNWISSYEEAAVEARPAITAFRQKAAGQIAGSISSVQLPMTILRQESMFWALSKNEFSLDINNKKAPKILCIANDPILKKALSPAIGLIIKTCMNNMNQQGKIKSAVLLDEFPQIYLPEVWDFPATARSNKVIFAVGYQTEPQLEEGYGKTGADSIIGNLGNQFHGMSNDVRIARNVTEMFGKIKYEDVSHSESQSGESQSYSIKQESKYQIKDIMTQDQGHFMGKVAGGKPALFSAQFEYNEIHIIEEIPPFALDHIENRTGDLEKDTETLQKMVTANFKQINYEMAEIMSAFAPVPKSDAQSE